jgi:hypothetical protein
MNKNTYSLAAVIAVVLAGGGAADAAGFTPDVADAIHHSPLVIALIAYLELRWRPVVAVIAEYARRELGASSSSAAPDPATAEDLLDQVSARIERAKTDPPTRKTGPVGIVKP